MTDKKVKRKKAVKEIVTNETISPPLTQLYYEIDTLKEMMGMFTDSDLYDHCAPLIDHYKHVEMDSLYDKLAIGKKLEPLERKQLEAFCILASTELFLVV